MSNANLIAAVDNLLWSFGGYAEVINYLTPAQLVACCLFGGASWVTSPLTASNGLPYFSFDLTQVGYQPNTNYLVSNAQQRFQFRGKVAAGEDGSCYWGLSPQEKAFLATAPHASRWFFTAPHPSGPLTSQFFVDRRSGAAENLSYLNQIINAAADVKAKPQTQNEVFIAAPAPFNLYVVSASVLSITSFEQLLAAPHLLETKGLNSGYLRPHADLWLTVTDAAGAPLSITASGANPSQLKVITDPAGYELLFLRLNAPAGVVSINQAINGIGSPLITPRNNSKMKVEVTAAAKD